LARADWDHGVDARRLQDVGDPPAKSAATTGNSHVPAFYLFGSAPVSFAAIMTFKGSAQTRELG